jgi:hypothetical protein
MVGRVPTYRPVTAILLCVEAGGQTHAGPGPPASRRGAQLMPLAAQAFCNSALEQTFSLVVKPSAMTSFTLSL